VQKVWRRIKNDYDLAIRVNVNSIQPQPFNAVEATVYISEGYAPFDFANMHEFLFRCDGKSPASEIYPGTYPHFFRHDVVRAIESVVCGPAAS
jgi:hypothetical protein